VPFQEAKKFALSLNLKSGKEWRDYCAGRIRNKPPKPENIPSDPNRHYKGEGWEGMGDWLGTGTRRLGEFLPFLKARKFARSLKLSSAKKWFAFCKGAMPSKGRKPSDIPFDPQRIYKETGWINWGDWLGTGTVSTQTKIYMPFIAARKYVHRLKLSSAAEWLSYCKGKMPGKLPKPENIPAYPGQTYKEDGWAGMRDWLGTNSR
jgi:hypothetical protein